MVATTTAPRVWLAAGIEQTTLPPRSLCDRPTVRDDQGRHWQCGDDGLWHTPDNRHHQTWGELHSRTDLTEVIA